MMTDDAESMSGDAYSMSTADAPMSDDDQLVNVTGGLRELAMAMSM